MEKIWKNETLGYEELMATNLVGFTYSERSFGMTMTSRHGSIDTPYVVVYDDGVKCIAHRMEESDGRYGNKEFSKKYMVNNILTGGHYVHYEREDGGTIVHGYKNRILTDYPHLVTN